MKKLFQTGALLILALHGAGDHAQTTTTTSQGDPNASINAAATGTRTAAQQQPTPALTKWT